MLRNNKTPATIKMTHPLVHNYIVNSQKHTTNYHTITRPQPPYPKKGPTTSPPSQKRKTSNETDNPTTPIAETSTAAKQRDSVSVSTLESDQESKTKKKPVKPKERQLRSNTQSNKLQV